MKATKRDRLEAAGWTVGSAADPTVSVDLLLRSLLRLGAKRKDIARAMA